MALLKQFTFFLIVLPCYPVEVELITLMFSLFICTFKCRCNILLLHHAKCMLGTHVLYWCRLEYFIPHPLQKLQSIRKDEILPHHLYFNWYSVPTHNTFAPYLSLHYLQYIVWILHWPSAREISLDLHVSIYVHHFTHNSHVYRHSLERNEGKQVQDG